MTVNILFTDWLVPTGLLQELQESGVQLLTHLRADKVRVVIGENEFHKTWLSINPKWGQSGVKTDNLWELAPSNRSSV